jgi:hypothetical protein
VVEARWGRSPKRRISEEDEAWQADLTAVGTYRFLMLTISADDTSPERAPWLTMTMLAYLALIDIAYTRPFLPCFRHAVH